MGTEKVFHLETSIIPLNLIQNFKENNKILVASNLLLYKNDEYHKKKYPIHNDKYAKNQKTLAI